LTWRKWATVQTYAVTAGKELSQNDQDPILQD